MLISSSDNYHGFQINGKWVLKSGYDFGQMSRVTWDLKKKSVDIERIDINESNEEDGEVKMVVKSFQGKILIQVL